MPLNLKLEREMGDEVVWNAPGDGEGTRVSDEVEYFSDGGGDYMECSTIYLTTLSPVLGHSNKIIPF